MTMIPDPAALLRQLFDIAVKEADPMGRVPGVFGCKAGWEGCNPRGWQGLGADGRSGRNGLGPCEGFVITRYGYARDCAQIEIAEAAHPVPDEAGVRATQELLRRAEDLGPDDTCVMLISGGGSALLCAPAEGLTLNDKQELSAAMLASGMPIGDINGIRKELSGVKGGRLAAAVHPATLKVLMISDVPGDDPGSIASGPTVGHRGNADMALRTLADWEVDAPASVVEFLANGGAPLAPEDSRLKGVENIVISAPSQSLEAAAKAARALGIKVRILGDDLEGEARQLAAQQAAIAIQIAQNGLSQPVLLLSGGECTVTRTGNGVGGPNAEFTLAAAIALDGHPKIHVLACDTDGVDGADEVAGAIAGPTTLDDAKVAGVDPRAALDNNDAHSFFAALGAQVIPGPTLTNVNDFRAILVLP